MVVKNYEGLFLLDSGYASANWDAVVKEIVGILERRGAEIIRLVKWDDRRLAYEIRHHKRGTYVLVFFKAPGKALKEIERDAQLSETILRLLVVRRERMDEQAMLSCPIPSGEANVIGAAPEPVAVAAPARAAKGAEDKIAESDDEPVIGDDEVVSER
jgi:ribosomal protein S6